MKASMFRSILVKLAHLLLKNDYAREREKYLTFDPPLSTSSSIVRAYQSPCWFEENAAVDGEYNVEGKTCNNSTSRSTHRPNRNRSAYLSDGLLLLSILS